MSDELVIEQIRRAMRDEVDGLVPRPETLERVLASLPRRRLGWGWLAPALAVGVAVAVAIVAVTSLSHRSGGPGATESGVPRGAAGLVHDLAVLRRPQTASDRLPGWAVPRADSLLRGGRLVPSLTRLVGSVQLGHFRQTRVYLIVDAPSRRELHAFLASERNHYVAGIAFVTRSSVAPREPTVSLGGLVSPTRFGIAQVADLTGVPGAEAGIVSNPVARVRWQFLAPSGRIVVVRPRVRDNVALATGLSVSGQWIGATWYGRTGRKLGTLVPEHLSNRTDAAVAASVRQPVAPVLVRHFAILRRPRGYTGLPGLDGSTVASLIEPNPVGLNLASARLALYPPTSARLMVVPGAQGMALSSVGPLVGQASGGLLAALDGELVIESARVAGHRTILGLAPDGNSTVTVLLPGGSKRTARVIDNVYAIVVPAGPGTVVILVRNAAGRVERLRE